MRRLATGNAAFHLAPQALARLAHLSLTLNAWFLIKTTSFELLKNALFGHFLLQDLHRLLEAVPNVYLYRFSKGRIHGA